jgi:uncharacterized protein YwqG
MSNIEEYTRLNTRKASVLHVGGLRPTNDPFASNFGLKPLGNPGEEWPALNGKPLLFVCQLNLTTAPFVPALLEDIKMMTFFAKPGSGSLKRESGTNWHLRAYKSLDGLVPIEAPPKAPSLKRGFECRWEEGVDHPIYDDPDLIVPEGFDNSDVELDHLDKTKIGGYPSNIQSEQWWHTKDHPAAPAYCWQIDSEEKAGLMWGDGGTVYLARGTASGCEDQWFLDWQTY